MMSTPKLSHTASTDTSTKVMGSGNSTEMQWQQHRNAAETDAEMQQDRHLKRRAAARPECIGHHTSRLDVPDGAGTDI